MQSGATGSPHAGHAATLAIPVRTVGRWPTRDTHAPVASRDPAAFGELYDRFVERVYRYLYLRTGRQAEAEDLTEQVFLKAWEAIGRYRWQGRPFLAWLYRLAHNTHIDHVRTRKPTTSLNSEDRPLELASSAAALELARAPHAAALAPPLAPLTAGHQQ